MSVLRRIRDWWTPKPPNDEVELNQALHEMGISIHRMGDDRRPNIPEGQRRWFEGKRAIREHRLWIVALAAAISAIISAATALVAVLR